MKTFFKKSLLEMRAMKKGTLFVLLFILLVLGACKNLEMQAGAEWLREPELEDVQSEKYLEIPQTDIYEVTAPPNPGIYHGNSQRASIFKLSPELAVWYTGHYYTCPADKQPYLVRAVYGHAGTGAFSLKRFEDDLLILHQSMGHSTIYQKTALVVNLDYEPNQVFIRVKIAE
jgi:hypothetical protein